MNRNIFTSKPTAYTLIFFTVVIMTGMLYGCTCLEVKDNKVYEVNQDNQEKNQETIKKIDGQISINEVDKFCNVNFQYDYNRIPITQSPDNKYVFYLSPVDVVEEKNDIIYGEISSNYNLVKYDIKSGNSILLKSNVPLISLVKWSPDGKIVAFAGKDKLLIYNIDKNAFMFEDEVKRDYVSYFGWSPDGKRLYTEHPDLVNNTIYYMNSNEKVEAYNSNESIYYKGKIDEKYYYVTINEITKPSLQKVSTLIVDNKGNKIRKLCSGKFRDNYKSSALLVGENGFGLYYFKNINISDSPKIVSKEYIYDAKFIYNGNFVYTIKNKDMCKDNFIMFVLNNEGKEIAKFEVSGGSFMVYPDGTKAQVSGKNREIMDFKMNSIEFLKTDIADLEKEEIFNTVRGGMNLLFRYVSTGQSNINEAKKYFINNSGSEQCALFDVENMFKEKNEIITAIPSEEYDFLLNSFGYKIYEKSNLKTATVNLLGNYRNSGGTNANINLELELICSDNKKWHISGFSTFSNTQEYLKLKNLCNSYIKSAKEGKMFNGQLKGKELSLGQIQFWEISKPGLALTVDEANYCKVYVKSKEKDGKVVVYKMILHKDTDGVWIAEDLQKDRMSYLY